MEPEELGGSDLEAREPEQDMDLEVGFLFGTLNIRYSTVIRIDTQRHPYCTFSEFNVSSFLFQVATVVMEVAMGQEEESPNLPNQVITAYYEILVIFH